MGFEDWIASPYTTGLIVAAFVSIIAAKLA